MDEVDRRSYDGGYRAQLTRNDRDIGGHKAHEIEASRNFSFPILPRVLLFFSYDRVV